MSLSKNKMEVNRDTNIIKILDIFIPDPDEVISYDGKTLEEVTGEKSCHPNCPLLETDEIGERCFAGLGKTYQTQKSYPDVNCPRCKS